MRVCGILTLLGIVLAVELSTASATANAEPTKESLDATGQLMVDTIKENCRQAHPNDESEYRNCATVRYEAMSAFFEMLFHYRDTKGPQSSEFRAGIDCVDNASPLVSEPTRQKAVEKADWEQALKCYEAALR